jgi:hypothetical protein
MASENHRGSPVCTLAFQPKNTLPLLFTMVWRLFGAEDLNRFTGGIP